MKDSGKNKAAIGAFVLGAVALAVIGVILFGGGQFFSETNRYVMFFEGSVKGLSIGAPVTFIILGVGTVGLGIASVAPMGIAIITAQLTVSALRLRRAHDSM